MKSRVIDPLTRDYVRSGGGRATTTTIATSLYHAIRARRGAWIGDPDRGSYVWRLARRGLGPGFRAEADNTMREALQPFIDEGLARDLQLAIDISTPRRALIEGSIVDVQAGAIDLSDVTRFEE